MIIDAPPGLDLYPGIEINLHLTPWT